MGVGLGMCTWVHALDMHSPCTIKARAPRLVRHVSDDVPRQLLREQHVGHRRGVSLVVVIGRVAYRRLDTAPPRVGAERAVIAREAWPAEAKARLEAGVAHATVGPHRVQDGILVRTGRAVGDVACM